jgi:hypothetical protein
MTKAKDTADAERQARRRRLEALRDDCRRHLDGCVRILYSEGGHLHLAVPPGRWVSRALGGGRAVEMALVGGDFSVQERARGLLARLGELIVQSKDAAPVFADTEDLAMFTLAMRAKEESSWTVPRGGQLPPMPESDGVEESDLESAWRAAGMVRQSKREVPDLRAAIAELCDELLEVKTSATAPKQASRTDDQKFAQASAILLQEFERSGKMLRQNQVAARIGMREEDLSRLVGKSGDKHDSWKRLKESLVSRRPDSKATRSVDDEDE